MRLKDKIAIVTGAATGLGLAIARKLAREGAKVVIGDIREPQRGVEALAADGLSALAVEVDVASESSVEAMVQTTVAAFGTIDILVNNAAISQEIKLTPFEQISRAEFDRMLSVNTVGVFLCCKRFRRSCARSNPAASSTSRRAPPSRARPFCCITSPARAR